MIDNFPLICFKLNFLEQDDLNCPTGVVRLHISCWTVEYQLLCKRTSAVVRLKKAIESTTYVSSSTDFLYLFQRLDLYALKV